MPIHSADPFPTDALEANRSGQLTKQQRDRLRPLARYARQSALIGAGVLVVASLMVLTDRQLSLPGVLRVPLAGICVVFAAVFLLRAIIGGDALSRDLRHMTVQSAEGPIGKHRGGSTGRSGRRAYLFDVGDGTFRAASRASYDTAPDAGMVRVFFLPRSRRVVNLERLPDVAFAPGTTAQDVVASLGAAVRSHSRRDVNELRAKMAPVMDAVKGRPRRAGDASAVRRARSTSARAGHRGNLAEPDPDDRLPGGWQCVGDDARWNAAARTLVGRPRWPAHLGRHGPSRRGPGVGRR